MVNDAGGPGDEGGAVIGTSTGASAVVRVGKHGGRGFILAAGERRYVVTAAHCIFDKLPVPHPARDRNEVTYRNLIGPLGGKRHVTAECVFLDAIADIAVFGAPDAQEEAYKAEAYEALTGEVAFKIGKMPARQKNTRPAYASSLGPIPQQTWLGPSTSEARMPSLDGEWFSCRVTSNGGPLWFDQAAQPVIGGMSGSPIVLPDGRAVGVVSTAESSHSGGREGGPNPMLAAHLPGWLLAEA